jgi:hypothetical protein
VVEREGSKLLSEAESVGPQDRLSHTMRLLLAQTLHARFKEGSLATIKRFPGGRARGCVGGE